MESEEERQREKRTEANVDRGDGIAAELVVDLNKTLVINGSLQHVEVVIPAAERCTRQRKGQETRSSRQTGRT